MSPSAIPSPDAQPEPASPRALGEFTLVREIGRGGMGVVYEAEQADTHRRVALKVVRGGRFVDDGVLRLFRREIQALARLEHPGIASIHASGRTDDGLHYFAMELVEGEPLDAWLRGRGGASASAAEIRARLALFLQIADAVAYAHRRGVLHRDLKPSNLFVCADGRVKVLDFGLARITDSDVEMATAVTETGTLRGTIAYMSPEQLSGDPSAVDARADVYALGVVLFETLAREHPYDLERVPAFDLARTIRDEPPKPLGRAWKGRSRPDADLATIVAKAMEKDPVQRYESAGALAEDVRRYLAGLPILARAPSAAYQLRKLVSRHRAPFAVLSLGVVLLAGFGASMAVLARHLAAERNRANSEAARANDEARASEQAAKALSGLVGFDLTSTVYRDRTLDVGAIERTVGQIEERWRGKPETVVGVLENVGTSLAWAGRYDAAIRLLERAVVLRRDVLHDPDWDIGARRLALGEYAQIAGRLDEADSIFASVAARLRGNPRFPPNSLAYALEDLGCVRRDMGRYDESERLLREALATYLAQKPAWPPFVASAHDSLGSLALAKGDLARAEAEHREALSLRRTFNASDSYAVRSESMLGLVLVRRGKLDEARVLLEGALAKRETLNGPDTPEAAQTLDALAELHLARGRLDLAEASLDRAFHALDASVPESNPARAEAFLHLAELRRRQGRRAEARDALARATTIRERVLGTDHPDTRAARALLEASPL